MTAAVFPAACLAQLSDTKPQLNGKVEKRSDPEHIFRPQSGAPLSKSVRVLSGVADSTLLQGKVEDQTLDSALRSDNFALRTLEPRKDWAGGSSVGAGLSAGRNSMKNSLTWSVGDWGLRSWDGWSMWNGPGPGPARMVQWGGFAWDSAFDPRRMQVTMQLPDSYMPPAIVQGRRQLMPDGSYSGPAWTLPSSQPAPAPNLAERNVIWDLWYQQISTALYRNWKCRGLEPGEATLRLTVSKPRKIAAELLRSNNPSKSFKQGLLAAVSALNGSPVLDFPAESARQAVSFASLFSAGTGTTAGAYSERRGEVEQVFEKR